MAARAARAEVGAAPATALLVARSDSRPGISLTPMFGVSSFSTWARVASAAWIAAWVGVGDAAAREAEGLDVGAVDAAEVADVGGVGGAVTPPTVSATRPAAAITVATLRPAMKAQR